MSTPPSLVSTDLGETRKLFERNRYPGRAMRDLCDTGEVFLLACEIADGDARRASLLSMDECRAIASLAAGAGVVLHAALKLVEASDAGSAAPELKAQLEALCNATRSLMKGLKS